MSLRIGRLGVGEWLVLAGAVGLLADLFALRWFSYPSGWYAFRLGAFRVNFGQDGWQGLSWLAPIAAAVALVGLVIVVVQASRRSPAVPIVLTTLLTPAAVLLVVALAVRTLIAPPHTVLRRVGGGLALSVDSGAYVGLGFAFVLSVGLYLSLRREGVAARDAPSDIETIKLETAAGT